MDTQGGSQTMKKRQRSENWLEEDKNLLKDLVRERVSVLENKNTDTNTNSKKQAVWGDLQSSFNSMCVGGTRTLPQLKSQWGLLKMAQKKKKSEERKYIIKTGGGPPPPKENGDDTDDISSWLPNEFDIETNEFDSDQINLVKVKPIQSENTLIVNFETNDLLTNDNIIIINEDMTNKKTELHENVVTTQEEPPDNISRAIKRPIAPLKRTRKNEKNKPSTYAGEIARTEMECRRELHQVQMENEKKKSRNLELKEILILKKIEYYEKKIKLI